MTRRGRLARWLAAAAAGTAAAGSPACGGGDDVTAPGGVGVVAISAASSGPRADADGFQITLDGTAGQALAPGGAVVLPGVPAGDHLVGLAAASLAAGCAVEGENPRTVSVAAGDTTRVDFRIACALLGSPPVITSVGGPTSADNTPGAVAAFEIAFSDPDGDVTHLTVVAADDPRDAVDPDSVDTDVRAAAQNLTAGVVPYTITCAAESPALCGAGPATLRFQLVDAGGNRSAPQTLTLAFGVGNSPAITVLDAPARVGVSRGSRTRIRIGFDDPDGDVVRVRVEELSDTGQVLNPEPREEVSDQAGGRTTGTVTIDYFCFAPVGTQCRTGTVSLRFTLVDLEGNSSRPMEAAISFEPTTGTGTAPVITRLDVPRQAGSVAGTIVVFRVSFQDPDADVTILRIQEVADPAGAFPGDVELDVAPQAAGLESGEVGVTLTCNPPPGESCTAGVVTLRFVLADAAGNASAPMEATIEFLEADAPAGVNAKNPRGLAPGVLRR